MELNIQDINTIENKLRDKEFRQLLQQNPQQYARQLGYDFADMEFKVVKNSKAISHIVIPYSTEQNINLDNIQAAGEVGSAGTASSASTLGSICSTWSCAASTGTASTVA